MEGLFTSEGRLFMYVRCNFVGVEVPRVSPISGRVLVNAFLTNYLQFNCMSKGLRRNDVRLSVRRLLVRFLAGGDRGTLARQEGQGVRGLKIVTMGKRDCFKVGRDSAFGFNGSVARFNKIYFRRFAANESIGR